jgi:hypothetical protein
MTPRTRTTNKDANFKIYYSKRVPQQAYFPHRRKIVRRPSAAAKDVSDKKQMRFLPDMMRVRREVADSDAEEDEEDVEEGGLMLGLKAEGEGVEEGRGGKKSGGRKQKRRRGAPATDDEDDREPSEPVSKRRRKATAPKPNRRSKHVEPTSDDKDNNTPATRRNIDRSRTLRRQSTMTQLVEGRRPMSDTDEPTFRPVKRSSRLSWSGQGKKAEDRKQRTLTQMVHGMHPVEIMSEDDMEDDQLDKEAEERESQAYQEATAAVFAESLVQDNGDEVQEVGDQEKAPHGSRVEEDAEQDAGDDLPAAPVNTPSLVVQSVEDTDEDEESYQPTQFIDAPSARTRRAPRRTSAMKPPQSHGASATPTSLQRTGKSKFGLLSTPERRRIREIPSSQSPAESPLSTQVSPSKAQRAPLQERSNNLIVAAETPSRRKQVTFSLPAQKPIPPLTLRKFRSTIQDSEDEEDDLSEVDESQDTPGIGALTQAVIRDMDRKTHGRDVGDETQAMLDRINQACGNTEEDLNDPGRESSEELGVSIFDQAYESSSELGVSIFDRTHEPSPELGELPELRNPRDTSSVPEVHSPYRGAYAGIKKEPEQHAEVPNMTVLDPLMDDGAHSNYRTSYAGVKQEQHHDEPVPCEKAAESADSDADLPTTTQVPSSPPILQPIEDTCPSTPLVIMDSSDEEDELELEPTPPCSSLTISQPSKNTLQQSTDLDADPIQVPRSPTVQPESQRSHSSKAEQQLQNEWFSYSQYVKARPAESSSMHVAHDKFSYDATPHPPRPTAPYPQMSQATTVDEVTPRKNRTQCTISANTTPRRIASSQPMSSPVKPPPLFIPSSFPSPAKARMEEWSSPVYGRTQDTYGGGYHGGSLEDFSIPPPPPIEDDDD